MRIIADLQIHSKYSRACSQDLEPGNIGVWAEKKGINVIGTGDLTHPKWLASLKAELEEQKPGLFKLKNKTNSSLFMLTGEVSSIYKQGDKVRRIHNMIFSPSFEATDRLIAGLEKVGANLKSDGRPIMGVKCPDLVKIAKEADENIEIIPAHAWTPHFGLFGSLSGFDTVEEAFGDMAKYIFAIETGLSSDPKMNWQISALDNYALVSNSDAHSLRKLGREANMFEIDEKKLSYEEIMRIIKNKDPKEFVCTLEFFPEEGKYHLDGHADCKFSCLPDKTEKLKGLCPVCGKKLLVGVLNRVEKLADRKYGFVPKRSVPFKSVIPLEEIIAETLGVGTGSKKVLAMYEKMTNSKSQITNQFPITEFQILLDLTQDQISNISTPAIAQAVMRVREGRVHVEGGYDGVFGKIEIFSDQEREKLDHKSVQKELF
jgi:uncharacterized protein (TIGR00375 family)